MKASWFVPAVFSLCLVILASGEDSSEPNFLEPVTFKKYYSSCKALNPKKSGVQNIKVGSEKIEVYCDSTIAGRGWQVIQRRVNAQENFFRNWTTYENGFGDLKGNYFIGLNLLSKITAQEPHELYIQFVDFRNATTFAQYSLFSIGNVSTNYSLTQLGAFQGSVGESLSYHLNMPFSTFDRDNDRSKVNCAAKYSGAWWYNDCMASNLNGAYLGGNFSDTDLYGKGINWGMGNGFFDSYKTVNIMVRSKL
ncbi:hypothetical protein KR018_002789 [Drosophila ironensis]|nr:hypothetical protein KR018_002789 [Drosophila ironensis]